MNSRILKVFAVFIMVTLVAGSVAPDAFAQNAVRKLGRGLANILSGIIEFPLNIVDVTGEEGLIGGITYGVVKGAAMTVLRTGVGVYEVLTFPLPFPGGYNPIVEPEFLMGDDTF